MTRVKSIRQIKNFNARHILLRVDFNVPLKNGRVVNDYKIKQTLPTIQFLLKKKAKVLIVSHRGRPEFTKAGNPKDKKNYSLKPAAKKLSELLGKKVEFIDALPGDDKAATAAGRVRSGSVAMLENIRFDRGEAANAKRLAKDLSRLAEVYVNDAFGVSHRAHASVAAIKKYLPAYAGLLLRQEVLNLDKILKPKKPLVVVMGGAKAETKMPLIRKLCKKAKYVLTGGVIANNFLAARGSNIGKSIAHKEGVRLAEGLSNTNIKTPIDVIVSRSKAAKKVYYRQVDEVANNEIIYDIGPETMKQYAKYIREASTIVWNGPMGVLENNKLKHGSLVIARAIAARSRGRAFGLAGGGETIAALEMSKMQDYMDWISTGGGAALSYLAGKTMPGLKKIVK